VGAEKTCGGRCGGDGIFSCALPRDEPQAYEPQPQAHEPPHEPRCKSGWAMTPELRRQFPLGSAVKVVSGEPGNAFVGALGVVEGYLRGAGSESPVLIVRFDLPFSDATIREKIAPENALRAVLGNRKG